jgi:hypothetical protein
LTIRFQKYNKIVVIAFIRILRVRWDSNDTFAWYTNEFEFFGVFGTTLQTPS